MSKAVAIDDLVIDQRLQARVGLDADAVEEYAAAYSNKHKLPPIETFDVEGTLYVVDGFHRVPAAVEAGETFIRVEVAGEGSLDDAIWHAMAVNQGHGVRRTNEDKRRAVRLAVQSAIGREQSSRVIAEHLGVSDMLVGKVRKDWEAGQVQTNGTSPPVTRTGKDGKSYPTKPRKAPPPTEISEPQEQPDAPEPGASTPLDDDSPPPAPKTAVPMPMHGPLLAELADEVGVLRRKALKVLSKIGIVSLEQRVGGQLRQAEEALDFAVPVVCPRCNGKACGKCGKRGWVEERDVQR